MAVRGPKLFVITEFDCTTSCVMIKFEKYIVNKLKTICVLLLTKISSIAGRGNVRPAGHMRPAKHFNVAREHFLDSP